MSLDLSVDASRDLTLDLCTFLARLKYDDIPDDIIHTAKASILNSIGCGLSSSPASLPAAEKLKNALGQVSTGEGSQQATMLGAATKTTIEHAAIVNGLAMTARFFDDTHLTTLTHPSGAPLAAVLAFAESNKLSGKQVIMAYIIGVEVGLALAKALGLGPYKKGWHLTSIVGTFSAAAAISRLMQLTPEKMATALGHASSMSAGSRNVFATDTLIIHPGLATRNGILAAQLAEHGLSSTSHALEKWIKLMSTPGEESYTERVLDLLKQHDEQERDLSARDWALRANAFKPYPCGIVIHPLIDAGIRAHKTIFSDTQLDVKDTLLIVNKIEAQVSPMTIRLCGIRHPKEMVETLFSNYHGLAVGVIFGAGGIQEFSKIVADDSIVSGLRDRIHLVPNEKLRDNQTTVKFWYRESGKEHVLDVPIQYATGSLENPMSVLQLNAKFESQGIEGKLSRANIASAIEKLWNLEQAEDIRSLMSLLSF